ncbi:glutathione S-transferase [Bacterioplanes sanyensis]|uniref:glutathione transferase n=1 Tax=Bacterioplanes sanyensis TaxID=1249553 RepID=A0A222FN83_9GAMM|nr:glutathione S-transferase [Bacterioplanes sanyensis]ASP40142.1 glutathione S-transferase [Bacterioplanes sanyensis]
MIVLHHLEHSRSQRILWLLEELGVEYEIKRYQRNKDTYLAPESLKQVHPLGKSPVITDGEQTIAESGLIVEYLIRRYGRERFMPEENSDDYWQYLYWMHYAEGSLMPLMVMSLIFTRIETAPMPFFVKPIAKGIVGKVRAGFIHPNVDTHMQHIEQHLATHHWFVGEQLSGADIQMIFPLEAALNRGVKAENYPNIQRFVHQVHQLDSYKTALQKGGPYAYA